jgi:hypothetical protein
MAISREQYYLDLLNPEYNLCKTAGSCLGYKHTQEGQANMRTAHIGPELPEAQKEHIIKLVASNVGRKHSEATKAKQSATTLAFLLPHL